MILRRLSCFIAGGIMFLNGAILLLISNINAGYIALALLGLILLAGGIYYRRIPAWIKAVFITGMVLWFGASFLLFGYGWTDTVNYREDAVIVLGAGLNGEKPSKVLRNRLDETVRYYEKNPDAVIIVSGGQGPQEEIPEAVAMTRYLVEAGIPSEKILKEDQSTSTYENFLFSKEILDEVLEADYRMAFITNDFHIYRAGSLAEQVGFEEAAHFHSKTPWYNVVCAGLRECMAVAKHWVFGN